MALARIRQLSAHEVGHTLGLSHNYISSTQNRASVVGLILVRCVQRLTEVARADAPRDQIGIERIVELARQHLVAFRGHGNRRRTVIAQSCSKPRSSASIASAARVETPILP